MRHGCYVSNPWTYCMAGPTGPNQRHPYPKARLHKKKTGDRQSKPIQLYFPKITRIPGDVIQVVTILSPNVGGHIPPSKRVTNHHPKKVTKNCHVNIIKSTFFSTKKMNEQLQPKKTRSKLYFPMCFSFQA